MKHYELVVLFDPRQSGDDQKKVRSEVEEVIKDYLKQTDDMGLQDLMYDVADVRGNNKAYAVSYLLEADPSDAKNIEQAFKYFKGLMRVKLFVLTSADMYHDLKTLTKLAEEYEQSLDEKVLGIKKSFFSDVKNTKYISWKAFGLLKRQMTRFSDMKPRHFTGLSVSQQKKIRRAILRARELGFMPYVK